MTAAQRTELRRTVGYVVTEARRFADEVLSDAEATTLPTGDAPSPSVCRAVRQERECVRAFARSLERYSSRWLRGGR